jgi:hypothetical protein
VEEFIKQKLSQPAIGAEYKFTVISKKSKNTRIEVSMKIKIFIRQICA